MIYAKISYELILQKKFTESIIIHNIQDDYINDYIVIDLNIIISFNCVSYRKREKNQSTYHVIYKKVSNTGRLNQVKNISVHVSLTNT